ncbi:putative nucleotidyltransferase component of viral defense system [Dyadobacter sp. BE34]|uniref:Nucleotidyltransferase component of viral defense system n=1 Tax=Dyadobacter fermentans TaxID=94254 RepID=A0ABU1QYJ0_9BACT|nr:MULTISPECIES: nucleotidyl transferase AbiEii/AbiGii toxin family protein [Dyadobacter]MDR6806232.1 putative nucleotidyltransferase component of viral defense system [Dyadobacter fermentans]MDR7043973.1 putative nucleotidyltransferase component of viral defense system [Dyadobacter sp. BE242]MDR7198284.1 putative nucleotidyltransferase component of viral defense system [Dyadobacter sp. BE34]MDR7216247.1 putative nucleotidyltransferase component of viral defense system [Dyadobacter sp. BE31]MD
MRRLLALPELAAFSLVGGTNLALRLGHRISVDIDLFTTSAFNLIEVKDAIAEACPNAIELSARNQTLLYQINGIKTDLIRHQYPEISEAENFDGIRFASLPDVIAMKLGAVAGRGAKKDFWDVHALLKHFSVKEMIHFYVLKYPSSDPAQVVRSLVYFEDADPQQDPIDLLNITWLEVKENLRDHIRDYTRSILE